MHAEAAAEPKSDQALHEIVERLYKSVPGLMDPVKVIGGNIGIWRDGGSVRLGVVEHGQRVQGVPYAIARVQSNAGTYLINMELSMFGYRGKVLQHKITAAKSAQDLLAQILTWYKTAIQEYARQNQAVAATEPRPEAVPAAAVHTLTALIQRRGAQRVAVHGVTFYLRLYSHNTPPITVDMGLRNDSSRFTRIAYSGDRYLLRPSTSQATIAEIPEHGTTATALMRWAVGTTYEYAKAQGWLDAVAATEPPRQDKATDLLLTALKRVYTKFVITSQPYNSKSVMDHLYVDVHAPQTDLYFGFKIENQRGSRERWRADGGYRLAARRGHYFLSGRDGYGDLLGFPEPTTPSEATTAALNILTAVAKHRTSVTSLSHELVRRTATVPVRAAAELETPASKTAKTVRALEMIPYNHGKLHKIAPYLFVNIGCISVTSSYAALKTVFVFIKLGFELSTDPDTSTTATRCTFDVYVRMAQNTESGELRIRKIYAESEAPFQGVDIPVTGLSASAIISRATDLASKYAIANAEFILPALTHARADFANAREHYRHRAEAAAEPGTTRESALTTLCARAGAKPGGFNVGPFIVAASNVRHNLLLIVTASKDANDSFRIEIDGDDYVMTTGMRVEVARTPIQSMTGPTLLLNWAIARATTYGRKHGWIATAATEPHTQNNIRRLFETLAKQLPTQMDDDGYKHVTPNLVAWRDRDRIMIGSLRASTAPLATLRVVKEQDGDAVDVSTGLMTAGSPWLLIKHATTPSDLLKQATAWYIRTFPQLHHAQAATEGAKHKAVALFQQLCALPRRGSSNAVAVEPHLFFYPSIEFDDRIGDRVTARMKFTVSTDTEHPTKALHDFSIYTDFRLVDNETKLVLSGVGFDSYGPYVEEDTPRTDVTNMSVSSVLRLAYSLAAGYARKWFPELLHRYTAGDARFDSIRAQHPVTAATEPLIGAMDTSEMHTLLFRYQTKLKVDGKTLRIRYCDDMPEHRLSAVYEVTAGDDVIGYVYFAFENTVSYLVVTARGSATKQLVKKTHRLPQQFTNPDTLTHFIDAVFKGLADTGVFSSWLGSGTAQAATEPQHRGVVDVFSELVRMFNHERAVKLPGNVREINVHSHTSGTGDPGLGVVTFNIDGDTYLAQSRSYDGGFVHVSRNSGSSKTFLKIVDATTASAMLKQILVFIIGDVRTRAA